MKKLLPVLLLLSTSFPAYAQSETEIIDGRYEVVLMSLSEASNVNTMLKKFDELGYEVQIRRVTVNDTNFSRLTLGGFESLQNARASAEQLKQVLGYNSIWVNMP